MKKYNKYQLTETHKAKILENMSAEEKEKYWDEIDDLFWNLVFKLAEYSYTDVQFLAEIAGEKPGQKRTIVSDSFLDAKCDIKHHVLDYLEKMNKAWFPGVL
jgi:hypothetical protein